MAAAAASPHLLEGEFGPGGTRFGAASCSGGRRPRRPASRPLAFYLEGKCGSRARLGPVSCGGGRPWRPAPLLLALPHRGRVWGGGEQIAAIPCGGGRRPRRRAPLPARLTSLRSGLGTIPPRGRVWSGGGLDSTRLPAAAVGLGGWPLSHSPSVVEGNLGSGMVIRRGVGWRGRAPLVGHRDGGGGGGMDDGAAEVRADPHRRVWQQPGQAPSACVRPN